MLGLLAAMLFLRLQPRRCAARAFLLAGGVVALAAALRSTAAAMVLPLVWLAFPAGLRDSASQARRGVQLALVLVAAPPWPTTPSPSFAVPVRLSFLVPCPMTIGP